MTQIPWFDEIWNKNSFTAMFRRTTTGSSILSLVEKFIAERTEASKSGKGVEDGLSDRDMLSQLIELTTNNPSVPKWYVPSLHSVETD